MRTRVLQYLLVTGLALWVVGLWLVPQTLFPIGRYICHQRPERSFFRHGTQLPVCARCTGLYLGAALAAPLALALASSLASSRARWILGLAAAPTAITWTLEFAGIVAFSNLSRCIAALPLGFAAAWLVLSVLRDERSADAQR